MSHFRLIEYPLAFQGTAPANQIDGEYKEFLRLNGVNSYENGLLRYRDPRYIPLVRKTNKILGLGPFCQPPSLFDEVDAAVPKAPEFKSNQ